MPNKTIYISQTDEKLFEEAKQIAGESLSTVIARALQEFIARQKAKEKKMKEIKIWVGTHGSEREQLFIGAERGEWHGFSDDKEWYMESKIYHTQKGNWAVHLKTVTKAGLVTSPFTGWMNLKDSMALQKSDLIVANSINEFSDKLPSELMAIVESVIKREDQPTEFLDI